MIGTTDAQTLVSQVERLSETLAEAKSSITGKFLGQEEVVDLVLTSLLCGGHALLVGLPGLGKTRLVDTLATVMGLKGARVQFTPDLMPADILGSEVLETAQDGTRAFRFIEGPVFCQLMLADEINRASPRTQSALLQAMQEKTVTIAGKSHALEPPFHVLATQNPLEQEGTYPLPEAQLDRFIVQVNVDYPDLDTERDILLATTGIDDGEVRQVFTAEALIDAQKLLRQMPVGEQIVDAILELVRACRPNTPEAFEQISQHVAWGPGPRAAQALMMTIRARALLHGRFAPSMEDVEAMARPVLGHRMALNFAARASGTDLGALIEQACAKVINNRSAA